MLISNHNYQLKNIVKHLVILWQMLNSATSRKNELQEKVFLLLKYIVKCINKINI